MKPADKCSSCEAERPKHARWFWVDSNAIPPVVYCPACADEVIPDRVLARNMARLESGARAGARLRKRPATDKPTL